MRAPGMTRSDLEPARQVRATSERRAGDDSSTRAFGRRRRRRASRLPSIVRKRMDPSGGPRLRRRNHRTNDPEQWDEKSHDQHHRVTSAQRPDTTQHGQHGIGHDQHRRRDAKIHPGCPCSATADRPRGCGRRTSRTGTPAPRAPGAARRRGALRRRSPAPPAGRCCADQRRRGGVANS
jgi:hypothetical protein